MVLLLKTGLVILRIKKVEEKVGLKDSSIYQKISEGTFPTQVRLGARAVGWIESEIDAWIVDQVEKSRNVPFAAPIIPETKPGSAGVQPTLRKRVRAEQPFHPPKLESSSSFPGTGPPIVPPPASSNKGGGHDE
jgi:prophage regulatory protein